MTSRTQRVDTKRHWATDSNEPRKPRQTKVASSLVKPQLRQAKRSHAIDQGGRFMNHSSCFFGTQLRRPPIGFAACFPWPLQSVAASRLTVNARPQCARLPAASCQSSWRERPVRVRRAFLPRSPRLRPRTRGRVCFIRLPVCWLLDPLLVLVANSCTHHCTSFDRVNANFNSLRGVFCVF